MDLNRNAGTLTLQRNDPELSKKKRSRRRPDKTAAQSPKRRRNKKGQVSALQATIQHLIAENESLKNECEELKRAPSMWTDTVPKTPHKKIEGPVEKPPNPPPVKRTNRLTNLSGQDLSALWKEVSSIEIPRCCCTNPSRSSRQTVPASAVRKFKARSAAGPAFKIIEA